MQSVDIQSHLHVQVTHHSVVCMLRAIGVTVILIARRLVAALKVDIAQVANAITDS